MKFKKFRSQRLINISVNQYKIDWDKAPSKGQLELQKFLKKYWSTHIVLAEMPVPGTRMRCDIINCNLLVAIEYHDAADKGGHHNTYNAFFHKTRAGFHQALVRDFNKLEWFEANNLKVCEIYKEDLPNLSPKFFEEKFGVYL